MNAERRTANAKGLTSNLTRTFDHVFVGRQLFHTHRTPCMDPVGTDAYLRPKAELAAIVKTYRSVPEDSG